MTHNDQWQQIENLRAVQDVILRGWLCFVWLFQFIDLCILLGCDYCDSLRGIGPKRAVDLIKQHKTIEAAVKHIDTTVFTTFWCLLLSVSYMYL